MKKILNNNRRIVIVCLLEFVSLIVLCNGKGTIKDGLSSIWLIILAAGFTTGVNIFNYKILKEFNFRYYSKLLKIPSYFFAFIIAFAMAKWLLDENGAVEFFILQTASTGVYIGLCVTQKYCAKRDEGLY